MIVLFFLYSPSLSFLYSPTDRVQCQTLGYLINLGEKWYFSKGLISLSLTMWCWVSFHVFKGPFHFLSCELSISFADFSIRLSFFPLIFQRPLCSSNISSLWQKLHRFFLSLSFAFYNSTENLLISISHFIITLKSFLRFATSAYYFLIDLSHVECVNSTILTDLTSARKM